MTARPPGPPGEPGELDEPEPPHDPGEQRLASLLAELADDPDAPASTVTAESVLAAVRAQSGGAATPGHVPAPDLSAGTDGSDGVVVDGRKRFQGRRGVMVGLLAAACVAAVAAVVIPLSLRPSDTTTSAESASATNQSTDQSSEVFAALSAPAADQSAADLSASAAGSLAAQAPEAASGQADAELSGDSPAPTETGGDSAAAAAGAAACAWSPLSPASASALTESLAQSFPAGRFGAPGALIAGCQAEPVAGARLLDATGGSLVVTVAVALPGACASTSSTIDVIEAGVRCVSQGAGRYLSTDSGGGQIAYAYGNGLEVAVGKDRSPGALPEGDPLSADQLLAAAQAVLAAQG